MDACTWYTKSHGWPVSLFSISNDMCEFHSKLFITDVKLCVRQNNKHVN